MLRYLFLSGNDCTELFFSYTIPCQLGLITFMTIEKLLLRRVKVESQATNDSGLYSEILFYGQQQFLTVTFSTKLCLNFRNKK